MSTLFQYRRFRLPLRVPIRTARGLVREREGVYVRLEAADGRTGYGEAAPIPWFGTETADEIEDVCRGWGERLTEEQLVSLPVRFGCLRWALGAAKRMQAETPGENAGAAAEVEAAKPKDAWGVAALLPAGHAGVARVRVQAEAGFRVFKWKVGVGDPTDEWGWLDELCAELPSGAKVRLDANGAWDRRRAERWLERCAERPVEFVEQPVAPDAKGARDLLFGLAADFPTPLGLDESLVRDTDVEHWLADGWRGVFVVKPSLLGDAEKVLRQLHTAKAHVVFSSALETGLGAAQALALAFAWPGERRALGFGVWPLFVDARFDGPAAAPFVRGRDWSRVQPEVLWNALT